MAMIAMVSFLRRPIYFCLVAAFILTTLSMLQYYSTLPTESILASDPQVYSKCDFSNLTEIDDRWNQLATKYLHLRDDKFTVTISTYNRPKELARVLQALLTENIPSLLEVYVIWKNIGESPPDAYTTEHGVTVRYRTPSQNSLNDKLVLDMDYKTQAIFLSDDDIYFRPADLEFAFQTWRLYGRKQLTGGMARCTSLAPDGTWKYTFCENKASYNMIITNLAFSHVAILDAYNSDDPIAVEMRRYVDEQFNCEDIALNFIAAHISGSGPLLVRGRQQYVDISPSVGISKDPRHMAKRHACVNHFVKTMGCMPLIEVEGRIEHSVKHNVWYTTFNDRLWG